MSPKNPKMWTPEFIRAITINGHYVGDSCKHDWHKEVELRRAYNREHVRFYRGVTCSVCGRVVETRTPKTFYKCGKCKFAEREANRPGACWTCGKVPRWKTTTRKFPYCLKCRNSIKEAKLAVGDRHLIAFEMRLRGTSFEKIAEYFGVSRQRAYQLYQRGMYKQIAKDKSSGTSGQKET